MRKIIVALLCLFALSGCKSKETRQDVAEAPVAEKTAGETGAKDAPAPAEAKPEQPKQEEPEAAAPAPNPTKDPAPGDELKQNPEDEVMPEDDADDADEDEDYEVPQDGTIEEKMASLKWESGYVGRFEFDYEAPSFMKEMPAPANNDGSTYAWKDMVFRVWGAHDMYDGSAQKALDSAIEFLGHAPHYKSVNKNAYIMSDYTKEGNIFYRKCVFKNDQEHCEELEYPKAYKQAVDPIVKKIAAFDVK